MSLSTGNVKQFWPSEELAPFFGGHPAPSYISSACVNSFEGDGGLLHGRYMQLDGGK